MKLTKPQVRILKVLRDGEGTYFVGAREKSAVQKLVDHGFAYHGNPNFIHPNREAVKKYFDSQ
jgi:hypothetical protein